MRKTLCISLLTFLVGGLVGYVVSAWRWRQFSYYEKLAYVRYTAPLTLNPLVNLNKNQQQAAIEGLERDLDTKIIVLGYDANDTGELGQDAREFLKQAAAYRKTSSYTPRSMSVKNRIDYILLNGCWDKP